MGILNYSDDQVKTWLKDKTPDQIAQQAASMGLNQSQINEALKIGGIGGATDAERNATINGYTSQPNSNYTFNGTGVLAQRPQTTQITPAGEGMWVGGKWLPKADITAFYANGGDDNQFAQQNGITDPWQRREMIMQARAMGGAATGDSAVHQQFNLYKKYNPNGKYVNDFTAWAADQGEHTINAMRAGTYTGAASSPSDWAPGGIYAPGTGHDYSFAQGRTGAGAHGTGDGWSAWTGAAGENSPGGAPGGSTVGGVPGGGSVAGGTPSTTGQTTGGGSAGSTTTAGGTTGPGNWQVTPEQTVESRVAGILASGNPLVAQRRAQSDMRMNQRGLLNSSVAQTASEDAAISAALDIARPDAATYADAAKTNANAQTTWGISQSSQQNSKDIAAMNIAAQKELQEATQLYNNLATQTASASSIQNWGLQTITTIQMSDLSPEAKNAAVKTIQQYLADSYLIQGDWHTSAAQAINAIFD